jgi:hypothetical protein
MKPTIVLVHGAYAESSSWNDVIPPEPYRFPNPVSTA